MRLVRKYSSGVIYAISSPEDGVVYIGATRTTLASRMAAHRGAARAGRQSPITRWMAKNMGVATAEIVLSGIDAYALEEAENIVIRAYLSAGVCLLNIQVTFYDKSIPDDVLPSVGCPADARETVTIDPDPA